MLRQRFYRWILSLYLSFTLSIAIIGFSPLPNLLAKQLYTPAQIVPSDCIILLGGGVTPDGRLSSSSLERTLSAAILFRQGLAQTMIISTGIVQKKSPFFSEAKIMQEVLLSLGIPESAMLLEEQSRRTAENAREVSRLMKKFNYDDALLVTSSTHMPRSLLSFRKYGITIHPAPVPSSLENDCSFFARIELFRAVCHEYAGMLYYRARGWI